MGNGDHHTRLGVLEEGLDDCLDTFAGAVGEDNMVRIGWDVVALGDEPGDGGADEFDAGALAVGACAIGVGF